MVQTGLSFHDRFKIESRPPLLTLRISVHFEFPIDDTVRKTHEIRRRKDIGKEHWEILIEKSINREFHFFELIMANRDFESTSRDDLRSLVTKREGGIWRIEEGGTDNWLTQCRTINGEQWRLHRDRIGLLPEEPAIDVHGLLIETDVERTDGRLHDDGGNRLTECEGSIEADFERRATVVRSP